MDRGAWWAAVYGIAQCQTRLKRCSSSSSSRYHLFSASWMIIMLFFFWCKTHLLEEVLTHGRRVSQVDLREMGLGSKQTKPGTLPLDFSVLWDNNFSYGLPRWLSGKESTCLCRRCQRHKFHTWNGEIPWRRKWKFNGLNIYTQTLCDPMDCSPPGSSVHGDSPGKNTAVSCHFLLQGIFLNQELNLGFLHCGWIHYYWEVIAGGFITPGKHMCVCVCVCIHTCIYILIYLYTHIYMQLFSVLPRIFEHIFQKHIFLNKISECDIDQGSAKYRL